MCGLRNIILPLLVFASSSGKWGKYVYLKGPFKDSTHQGHKASNVAREAVGASLMFPLIFPALQSCYKSKL